ncbi:MAG: MMPL family transporter [Nannocystis sp.]|nr:MMPL family transporter [Nannocystis sp.]MBA3545113.1 MMPL family transporter [Nannocystis sp.]
MTAPDLPGAPHPGAGFGPRLASFIVRFPALIVIVALLIGGLGFLGARRVGIDQELRAMLPDDASSVLLLDAAAERLGNQSDLYVSIRSPSREANLAFGAKIAAALAERPDIRYVLFHRDPAFFKSNALLYAKLGDLLELRGQVIAAIQARIRSELSAFGDDEPSTEPRLDFDEAELRRRYHLEDTVPEYFEADEGRLIVVRARPTRPNTDLSFARTLFREVDAAITQADPTAHHPAMEVTINGSYARHSKLANDLQRDIINGSLFAFGLLLLIVATYFRGLRAVPLVLLPLLISAVVALAFAYLVYGTLNLVSAFIFAVQLGLGIDFGTHMLARYREELAGGLPPRDALATAIATTGVSTAGGALSTAFAFLLLVLAEFRGFTQFGLVAFVGILVAYAAAIVVLPALVLLFDRVWPWKVRLKPPAPPPAARAPRRFPALALALLTACLGLAAYGASTLPQLGFEYNLNNLDVPDTSSEADRARNREFRGAVGKIQSTDPTLALTADLGQTRELHRQLQAILELSHAEVAAITGLPALSPDPEPTTSAPTPPPATTPAPADDEEDDEEFEPEPDDPRFVELGRIAAAHAVIAPETRTLIDRYAPERLREMDDLLVSVLSVYSFIPELQAEKLEVIRDIRERIDKKRGSLSAIDSEKLATWEPYLAVERPIDVADLPAWVKVQFTDMQGQIGRFVAFWVRGETADYVQAKRVYEALSPLESSAGPVPTIANYFVIPEIVDTIRLDGPRVMISVFGVLIVTALLMFRSVTQALYVLFTVVIALLWLAGVFALLDWKLNLFNLIALPLLIGMGQDDSLHLIHRYREAGPGSLPRVVRETGGAVLLTTLTTVIGFSSMLFVQHQGLRSLGWTNVIGMTLCLLSSVLFVPACLRISEWIKSHR